MAINVSCISNGINYILMNYYNNTTTLLLECIAVAALHTCIAMDNSSRVVMNRNIGKEQSGVNKKRGRWLIHLLFWFIHLVRAKQCFITILDHSIPLKKHDAICPITINNL